jgi:hypothetical protein
MQQAFIIRPFDTKKDSAGREVDFERIHRQLIAPAIEAARLGGGTPASSLTPATFARTCSASVGLT